MASVRAATQAVCSGSTHRASSPRMARMKFRADRCRFVNEALRVLKPDGCLFFTVNERSGNEDGYTAPELYKIVREGFDIIELKRPKWWRFGRDGKTMTVCARKKAWREHKGFIREGSLPFTPFRSRA